MVELFAFNFGGICWNTDFVWPEILDKYLEMDITLFVYAVAKWTDQHAPFDVARADSLEFDHVWRHFTRRRETRGLIETAIGTGHVNTSTRSHGLAAQVRWAGSFRTQCHGDVSHSVTVTVTRPSHCHGDDCDRDSVPGLRDDLQLASGIG